MSPLRLVFLGSDPIALPTLERLAGTAEGRALVELVAVYTQPDRPHGRGQKLQAGPIKEWALARNLPVFQPEKLGAEDLARIRELGTDVALVMAYGQLLKDDFIAAPRLGTFNLHTSALPKYRGASPVTAAIACGDAETAVSFMRIVRKLDAGAVAEVERVAIGAHDTTGTIEAALGIAAAPLTLRCLTAARAGTLVFAEQDETRVSYCRRLAKTDGVLDFTQPAEVLARRVNALQPWPGVTIALGDTPVKVGLAEAADEATSPGVAGGTVVAGAREAVHVATGRGVLRLLRLQRPGGKMLPAEEFLRGCPIPVGSVLPSAPMPGLVAARPFPRV